MKVIIENPSDVIYIVKKLLFHNRNIGRFSVVRQRTAAAATTTAVAGHAAEDLTEVGLQNITTVTQEERIENVLDTDAC